MNPSLKAVAVLASIVAFVSIAYYFAVALPTQNKAKLQFERDRFEQELKDKKLKTSEDIQKQNQRDFKKQNAEAAYKSCLTDAEDHYNESLQLNGKPIPGKKGSYSADEGYLKHLDDRRLKENDDCRSQFAIELKALEAK